MIYKTKYQYENKSHHFCSNKCQAIKRRELAFEYRPCEVCGSEMYLSKKSTKRFCSNECQHIWQQGNTGFKNSRFKGGYVVCETCKKEFLVGQYIYESGRHHFCSQECRQAWYANVWSQSDDWRNESRIRAASLMKTNKVTAQTRPQVLVNEFLEEMNIPYINEKTYDYYSVDNYLIDQNLIIEVMGDYWHSSPLKYVEKINDKQRHIISRYS